MLHNNFVYRLYTNKNGNLTKSQAAVTFICKRLAAIKVRLRSLVGEHLNGCPLTSLDNLL